MKPRIRIIAWVVAALLAALGVVAVTRMETGVPEGNALGTEFRYDIRDLRKTDPALLAYRQSNQIGIPIEESRAIAVGPSNEIYVAGDVRIAVLDDRGAPLRELELNEKPMCLTVGVDGRVYIGMKSHVEIHAADGKLEASWPDLGAKALLTSIAAGSNGVFVADAGNREVVEYSATGEVLNRTPGFIVPSPYFCVAIAPDGMLRAVNPGRHRVETYADGHLVSSWGKAAVAVDGFSGCCNPCSLTILPSGEFVTAEKGLSRVKIYSPDGAFSSVVAGPETLGNAGVMRVASDSSGRVLVLNPAQKTLLVFVKK